MPYEVTFATGRRVTVYNAEFLKHGAGARARHPDPWRPRLPL